MRGPDKLQSGMFSYISAERRVSSDHPLRAIRAMVDVALSKMGPQFETMYAKAGRPSIPPEQLLRALLLQILYTVRSERLLMEQLDYNILFRWFVGLSMDDEVWDGHKSFKKKGAKTTKPPDDSGNPTVDFSGEKRSNATHESTTDPEAKLYRKSYGTESKLCYSGHVLMDNRHGLAVGGRVTQATSYAEREAAIELLAKAPGAGRATLGADKAYDVRSFVETLRFLRVTPHIAAKARYGTIDRRT